MARSTDAGHDVNVANFQKLINLLKSFGAGYAPVKAQLSIAQLEAAYTVANKSITESTAALNAYRSSVASRSDAFKPLNKQITQLLNIFLVTDASDGVKDQAKSLADKIRGMNVKTNEPKPPETPATETDDSRKHSTSQQSYVKRMANLDTFLQIMTTESAFRSQPEVLTKVFWDKLANDLQEKTQSVDDVYYALSAARQTRNDVLYTDRTGIIDIAVNGVKKELKGAFGAGSNEFKQASAIPFRKPAI